MKMESKYILVKLKEFMNPYESIYGLESEYISFFAKNMNTITRWEIWTSAQQSQISIVRPALTIIPHTVEEPLILSDSLTLS